MKTNRESKKGMGKWIQSIIATVLFLIGFPVAMFGIVTINFRLMFYGVVLVLVSFTIIDPREEEKDAK